MHTEPTKRGIRYVHIDKMSFNSTIHSVFNSVLSSLFHKYFSTQNLFTNNLANSNVAENNPNGSKNDAINCSTVRFVLTIGKFVIVKRSCSVSARVFHMMPSTLTMSLVLSQFGGC